VIEVISLPKPKVGCLIMKSGWGSAKGFRFLSLGTVQCIRRDSQAGSGDHPPSYPIDTSDPSPGRKATGGWNWRILCIT